MTSDAMRRFGGLNREHLPQFAINLDARENESLVVLAGHAVQNGILVGRARLHSLETFCDVRAVAGAQAVRVDHAKPFLVGDHAVIREAEIASAQPRCFAKLAFHVVEGGIVVSDSGFNARRLGYHLDAVSPDLATFPVRIAGITRLAFLQRHGDEEMLTVGGRESDRDAAGWRNSATRFIYSCVCASIQGVVRQQR